MQYNIDASKTKETPRPFSIYIKSSKWKDSVAFKEDPEAGISSVLDTLVLLLSTIWVIDPCLLTHTVVLLAKPICFVVHTPVYTQEHPRKVSCFSHVPDSTSRAVGCILLVPVLVLPDLPIWLAAPTPLEGADYQTQQLKAKITEKMPDKVMLSGKG